MASNDDFDLSEGWCTIESDPGVFTELIESLGVKGAMFEEVLSIDDLKTGSERNDAGAIHGLIFLFKFDASMYKTHRDQESSGYCPEHLYFAKQVIRNACATQAILSIVLNRSESLNIGSVLTDFKSFMEPLDPETRGFGLGNSDLIRETHNSFRPHLSFEISDREDNKDKGEDPFHFIAYVRHGIGEVYELDGLAVGPVKLGTNSELGWVSDLVVPRIMQRIEEFGKNSSTNELRFSLMALVPDKREELKQLISSIPESSLAEKIHWQEQLNSLEATRAKWKTENERRRHDFTPLVLAMLTNLAKRGKLVEIFATAEKDQREKK